MHKFRATYLGAFILGWLLAVGVAPAAAYYSPLPATATFTSNSVSRTVYDPKLKKPWGFISWFGGDNVSVVDLKQHNGVIAWIIKHGTTYQVTCSVYDPGAGTFIEDTQGPFTDISQFQIVDGVVAYVAGMPPTMSDPAHPEFKYATYDPAKGAWQNRSHFPSWPNVSNLTVATKDGVVVVSYTWELIGYAPHSVLAVDIYNSAIGNWHSASQGFPSSFFTDNILTCQYVITNSTIYTILFHPTFGQVGSDTWGYDASANHWYLGPTKPMAHFVAQPKLGSSPLWVWFTDMSIAGANWSWDFGDNTSPSSDRSPYHIFTSPGNFQVTQWISGPSTYSQTITVLKGKSLPGMLHLLLLAD
ncbi:MAG: PKD domain-containing protein [Deltaproteobacteria bacterium]|nr:PKD domain-containing protein [Deltaproteobacteria bacterium]